VKILASWLREFVDVSAPDAEVARALTQAGINIEGVTREQGETIFEAEITPNRPDAMNHYGIARECAAIFDKDLKPLAAKLPTAKAQQPTASAFPIVIEDASGCARYTARVIRGVKIAPAPEPIRKRLELLGSSAISNAVDASNYVLQEMGHPTHAFDLDLLAGGKIIVRRARAGEKLKTLDGVERKLDPEDLVIADAEKPVALAGVMGGFDSMITERTRNVLIESAWFDPVSVRKTAKRHGMHTDASHRFERGADFAATSLACARVAELIPASAGGTLDGGEIDVVAREVAPAKLTLRRSEITRILTDIIPEADAERILRRLGFGITPARSTLPVRASAPIGSGGAHAAIAEEPEAYAVQAPTWRLDIEQEIDLIEELARIYGYDRFPNTLPGFVGGVRELPNAAKDAAVRSTLLALGYNEALSLTFISQEDAVTFSSAVPVLLANPLSEEAAAMRTSLVPGMLNMLANNLNRGNSNVRLFEAGHVFELLGDGTAEHGELCIGATGEAAPGLIFGSEDAPPQPPRAYTFFDMKGDLEALLGSFDVRNLYFDANAAGHYHPGRSARIVLNGATVGQFGQLHPEVQQARKLRQPVFTAELNLEQLYRNDLRQMKYRPIPRYPAVERDFSFVFADEVIFEKIRSAVESLRIEMLRSFQPVEIFRGGAVAAGSYSVLLRAQFQSADRTLRDDEVNAWSQQIRQALEALGGRLRA
jgi:phenylalanyl-tRNA synthetase beta chain